MRLVVIAGAIAAIISLIGTPMLIRILARHGYAQAIRQSTDDWNFPDHESKVGTPSMGGVAILLGVIGGYFLTHLVVWRPLTASGPLIIFLMVGLGLVGVADDYLKIFKQRSTGLRARTKLVGQAVVAFAFIKRDVDEHYTPVQWIKEMTPVIIETLVVLMVVIYVESLLLKWLH